MLDLVVIGGGLAGITVGEHAHHSGWNVAIIESRPRLGGRVKTERNGDGDPVFERGAWRISKDHHHVLERCRQLGLSLKQLDIEQHHESSFPSVPFQPHHSGLSVWDIDAFTHTLEYATSHDASNGYVSQNDRDATTTTYKANPPYFVPAQGMDALCTTQLPQTVLRLKTRVVDIEYDQTQRMWLIHLRHDDADEIETLSALRVCLALPPHALDMIPFAQKHLRALSASVMSLPLMHIYAINPQRSLPRSFGPKRIHSARGSSLAIAQSVRAGHQCDRLVYACGSVAKAWAHLWWTHGKHAVRKVISSMMPEAAAEDIALVWWPHAVHAWRPVPHLRTGYHTRPQPVRFPSLTVANEAWSDHQGWIEGAARAGLSAWSQLSAPTPLRPVPFPSHYIIVEGRVVDVSHWFLRHPGTRAPLDAYLEKDGTNAMDRIPHSIHAWAMICAWTTGWYNSFDQTSYAGKGEKLSRPY